MSEKRKVRAHVTMDGNHAAAEAVRQINPEVFGFYPITPTSYIGEEFAKAVADGKADTEYVSAESEHAALSICVGAAAAGVRAITATASQGLILMSEVIFNAAGMRLPIVLINGNRSLSAPLSIHGDHNDAMALRDAGWIQLFAENAQEVYDFLLCAYPIAEATQVRTPIMVCMDCFQTTHTVMNIIIESDIEVRKFIGEAIQINPLLDIDNPVSYGTFDRPNFYMEHRRAQLEGLLNAEDQTKKIFKKFKKTFGRGSETLVDEYGPDAAEIAVMVLGSTAGTLRRTVDFLEKKEKKIKLIRPKIFRPFPKDNLRKMLSKYKKILVLDRMFPSGAQFGALGSEVASLFVNHTACPVIKNAIYGLGSRETTYKDFAKVIEDYDHLPNDSKWINLRE